MLLAPEQTANLFPTITLRLVHIYLYLLPFERLVCSYGDFKREIVAKPTGKTAVTYFIMNGIEQVWGQVCGQVRGRLCPRVYKEVLPKRNPKNQKEQRTKNEHENKSRYRLGGIPCTRYILGGIQYRRYRLDGIQCWWYLISIQIGRSVDTGYTSHLCMPLQRQSIWDTSPASRFGTCPPSEKWQTVFDAHILYHGMPGWAVER